MSERTPEEEKKILESAPRGTMTLMLILAICTMAGWLYMYFGMFLTHGPVN